MGYREQFPDDIADVVLILADLYPLKDLSGLKVDRDIT